MSSSPRPQHTVRKERTDPAQGSFDLGIPPLPAARAETGSIPGQVSPGRTENLASADSTPTALAPAKDRRAGPPRARISFEAPARLKRKLERVARDVDRSKTALLRSAVEDYLKRLGEKEGAL
jgi:hypothetical protein